MKECHPPEAISILLVEDHAVVREGTRQLLEREPDMRVVGEAGDGEAAVRLAAQLRPDVIIMDVAMPVLNGIDATRRIKALLPSTAVLILTGYDYDEFVFALLEAGAAGYLLKTVRGDELVSAIRAVYAGEPVLHPVVVRKLMERYRAHEVRATHEAGAPEALSPREMDVLRLASRGKGNREIAEELCISARTVQAHLRNIFGKLGVGSRSEAVLYCLKRGWVTLNNLP